MTDSFAGRGIDRRGRSARAARPLGRWSGWSRASIPVYAANPRRPRSPRPAPSPKTWPSPELDPAVYLNPWFASTHTAHFVLAGVRWCWTALRRPFEVRRLNAVEVLPPGWDAAGRHCPH